GDAGAHAREVPGIRARGDLARVPGLPEAVPLREPAAAQGGPGKCGPRTARPAGRRGGAAMSALVFIAAIAVLAWSVAREAARRRRYREGWETVLRTLDAAVKVAPRGPRAAEAALLAGHARAELWKVSRSRRDGRAAISALRKVDADYAGPAGAEALALASRV